MNPISFHNTQTKRQYVSTTVGAGSLLKLNAKGVDGSTTDDTKPALAFQIQTRYVQNTYMSIFAKWAGFKFISNHRVNVLEYWHVNEPAPTHSLGGVS